MTLPAPNHPQPVYISDILTAGQSQALAARILSALQVTNRFEIKLSFDRGQLKYITTMISDRAPDGAVPMDEENQKG